VATRIPITRPALGEEEVEAAARVIRSGWVTQGPEVAAFEKEFAASVGAPFAVAVSNCTVALELALRVCGVGPGDDVVTVSHSFVATASSVVTVGGRPVFADVEADNFGLDPAALERALTPATKAILCVHQIGMPCDLSGVLAVAERRGLPLIEDAACAIGSEVEWRGRWERIGRPHGLLACFSLHPRKIVTTGDGGMLTTADPALAARLKLLRQHAMTVPDTLRHHSDKVLFESYTEPAFNYRMTDLQAAIGRPQLARLDAIVRERRALADRYREALAESRVFAPPRERPSVRSNWQSYALSLRDGSGLSQVEVLQALLDRGIAAKRGILNAHQEPAYAGRTNWACGPSACPGSGPRSGSGESACPPGTCRRLPVSEAARDRTVLIPLFHGMTRAEQDQVIEACLALDGASRP
jgi:dTDP-4-amino-4,6-dideoxygalactose transaminase